MFRQDACACARAIATLAHHGDRPVAVKLLQFLFQLWQWHSGSVVDEVGAMRHTAPVPHLMSPTA